MDLLCDVRRDFKFNKLLKTILYPAFLDASAVLEIAPVPKETQRFVLVLCSQMVLVAGCFFFVEIRSGSE